MPISYTYNTVFIHIPKCAGTTIEKILGTCTKKEYFSAKKVTNSERKSPQHFTYLELKNELIVDWEKFFVFSVVRNPYSRFVSEYNYRKYLFSTTQKQKYNPVDFNTFANSLNIDPPQRIQIFDGHLETQTSFLKNEMGIIEPSIQVFKFENLVPCWTILEEKTGVVYKNYLWSRKSTDETPYQEFYTPEIKSIVYNFYKEDFDNFGYTSEL